MTTKHRIQREGDEYACSCGLRWGLDDVDPHGATFGRNDTAGSPRDIIEQLKKDLTG